MGGAPVLIAYCIRGQKECFVNSEIVCRKIRSLRQFVLIRLDVAPQGEVRSTQCA